MRENEIRERYQQPTSMPSVPRKEFFLTLAGPGATAYPDAGDSPNVYYARQLKNVTFTETPGAQTVTYDTTDHYACVLNLESSNYIEAGSILLCDRKNGRWWTVDKVTGYTIAAVITDTVYALQSASGTTLWTYDLTALDNAGFVLGLQCRFDSSGRLWGSALAWDDASTDTTPRVIVYRLSDGGALQWSTDLGATVNTFVTHAGAQSGLSPFGSLLLSGDVRHLADGRCCVAHARLANDSEILSFFASDGTLDEQMGANNTTISVGSTIAVTQHTTSAFGLSSMTQDANGALWISTLTSSASGSGRILGLTLAGDWFSAGFYDDPDAAEEFSGVQATGGVAAHPSSAWVYTSHGTQNASVIKDEEAAERTLRLSGIANEELTLAAYHSLDDIAAVVGVTADVTNHNCVPIQVAYRDGILATASSGWDGFDTVTGDLVARYCRDITAASSMTPQVAIADLRSEVNTGDVFGGSRVCFEPVDNAGGGIIWGRGVFRSASTGTTAEIPLVQKTTRGGSITWSALPMSGSPHVAVTGLDCH